MMTDEEINKIIEHFRENIADIILEDKYFYNHLSLCVIEAVWSIGVRFEGAENVVERYFTKREFEPPLRANRDSSEYPEEAKQESVSAFLKYLKQHVKHDEKPDPYENLAVVIFENSQRTSTKNGILKAQAVVRFAEVLLKYHVNYFQDIAKIQGNELFESDIKKIPGQRSGISTKYFFMLSGDKNKIKPDRMIKRFLAKPLKKDEKVISDSEAQDACNRLYIKLNDKRITSIRHLDNIIWNFQRNEDKK